MAVVPVSLTFTLTGDLARDATTPALTAVLLSTLPPGIAAGTTVKTTAVALTSSAIARAPASDCLHRDIVTALTPPSIRPRPAQTSPSQPRPSRRPSRPRN